MHCLNITDQEMSVLTNLISFVPDKEITRDGICFLTNLTFLNLVDCENIIKSDLSNLVRLESVISYEESSSDDLGFEYNGLLPFFH